MSGNNFFSSILESSTLTGTEFLICTICAIVCGLVIALLYNIKNHCSKSFFITLSVLPAAVQMVIMLVNGNLGTGVAVAGAFSLVRFRSAPGKGQEIACIFQAMAVGLAAGMGYIGIAAIFTLVISGLMLILNLTGIGQSNKQERVLKITVPENLDFEGRFDNIFDKYLDKYTIDEVKTSNMGSLYKISYHVVTKANISVKDMMDELRAGNGNLEISLARPVTGMDEL